MSNPILIIRTEQLNINDKLIQNSLLHKFANNFLIIFVLLTIRLCTNAIIDKLTFFFYCLGWKLRLRQVLIWETNQSMNNFSHVHFLRMRNYYQCEIIVWYVKSLQIIIKSTHLDNYLPLSV